MKKILIPLLTIILFSTSCTNNSNSSSEPANLTITGAGATFPLPFYNLAIEIYSKESGNLVTYGGIGSGGGIRSLRNKIVDFGATDAFLTSEQEKEMPGEVIHIPTCVGAVVIAFNLPGIQNIKLSNQNIQEIFSGIIINWNDSKIKETNPTVKFPDLAITVVHRTDESGTTNIFSDYLCKISPVWEKEEGRGKLINWKTGVGANGNKGVGATILQTPGSIGYIGSEFAFSQNISFAMIENFSGKFISPTIESISAAAKTEIPGDTKIMLTNSRNPDAYPISAFTWLIIYKEQNYNNRTREQALTTVYFISLLLDSKYQTLTKQSGYSPLPGNVIDIAVNNLKQITYSGDKLLN